LKLKDIHETFISTRLLKDAAYKRLASKTIAKTHWHPPEDICLPEIIAQKCQPSADR